MTLQPRPQAAPLSLRAEPTVSVVIPTHNRQQLLERCLHALSFQTYPAAYLDVRVVADGCTDGTVEWLRAYPAPYRLTILETAGVGPAEARNQAVEDAVGELILFLDDDLIAEPELVFEHVCRHTAHPDSVVLGTALLPLDDVCPAWLRWDARQLTKLYRRFESGEREVCGFHFYSGNASLPAAAFRRSGGYDPEYHRAEDVELGIRLEEQRLRFRFCPEARGFHYQSRSLESWLELARSYGRADVRMMRDARAARFRRRLVHNLETRHPALRLLLRGAFVAPALGGTLARTVAAWVRATGGDRLWRIHSAALSWLNNWEYWRGVSEEWGVSLAEIQRELRGIQSVSKASRRTRGQAASEAGK